MHEATSTDPSILLIGASRGLGYGMAEEFSKRGWNVVGTVRGSVRTRLHDLADESPHAGQDSGFEGAGGRSVQRSRFTAESHPAAGP